MGRSGLKRAAARTVMEASRKTNANRNNYPPVIHTLIKALGVGPAPPRPACASPARVSRAALRVVPGRSLRSFRFYCRASRYALARYALAGYAPEVPAGQARPQGTAGPQPWPQPPSRRRPGGVSHSTSRGGAGRGDPLRVWRRLVWSAEPPGGTRRGGAAAGTWRLSARLPGGYPG